MKNIDLPLLSSVLGRSLSVTSMSSLRGGRQLLSTPPPMVSADPWVVGGKAAEFEFMLVIRVLSNLDAESHGMLRTITTLCSIWPSYLTQIVAQENVAFCGHIFYGFSYGMIRFAAIVSVQNN